MPSFDIVKKTEYEKTFKNNAIIGRYELSTCKLEERFNGNIDLPDDWNIGIIVGPSGSGKSTIAKEVFNYKDISFNSQNCSVIDCFKNASLEDIECVLRNVGFSSPPSWVKPYSVLSNGEKMRVDLAKAILSNDDPIVFDEFTSVVDRQIAKIGAMATSKTIKKLNKKFIAVSCHYDIIEWLAPDWIFDTADFTFRITRGLLRRPELQCDIRLAKGYWHTFSKYHYMSNEIHPGATQFVGFINNMPVAFIGVLHFPHPKAKNIKRVTRFVVHPEWQGVSIGSRFIESVGDYYIDRGFRFRLITSNPTLFKYFEKSKKWRIDKIGTSGNIGKSSSLKTFDRTMKKNIYTVSAEYIGGR